MNYSKIWRIWNKRHKPGESGESSWWCVWPKGRWEKERGLGTLCQKHHCPLDLYIYIYSISIQFFIYVSSFVLSTPAFISDIMLWGQKYWGAGPVRHLRKLFFAVRKDWNAISIHIIHIIHIIHEHSWTFMNIHEHSWTFMNIHEHSWTFMNIHEHSWTFMNIHEHSWTFMNIHEHSWTFMNIHEHSWTFMNIHEHSWTFMNIHEHSWTFMNIHEHSWTFMNIHEHSWTFMNIHEHSWTFMNIHEHSWTFMNIHEHSWTFMNIHEHSWTFMNIHEHSWTSHFFQVAERHEDSHLKYLGRSHQISPFWFLDDLGMLWNVSDGRKHVENSPPSEPLGNQWIPPPHPY